jgi:predicted phosphodiesterase
MRIFVLSDIHVDFEENRLWLQNLLRKNFKNDALILAGDITHHFDLLNEWLLKIRYRFGKVFYVPGNHDLWIDGKDWDNSLQKFHAIMEFCNQNDINVKPGVVHCNGKQVAIVPVFSWYDMRGENDSLYLPKPGEDPSNVMWNDLYDIHWPKENGFVASSYFLEYTRQKLLNQPVDLTITFSHFLPRREVMFKGEMVYDYERMKKYDRFPQFNFSGFAGSLKIDRFIRSIGTNIHVYGHQHINRDKMVDGVRYVAHHLGYPHERRSGILSESERGMKLLCADL